MRLARKTSNLKMANRLLGQAAAGSLAWEYEAIKCEYASSPSTATLHKLLDIASGRASDVRPLYYPYNHCNTRGILQVALSVQGPLQSRALVRLGNLLEVGGVVHRAARKHS